MFQIDRVIINERVNQIYHKINEKVHEIKIWQKPKPKPKKTIAISPYNKEPDERSEYIKNLKFYTWNGDNNKWSHEVQKLK